MQIRRQYIRLMDSAFEHHKIKMYSSNGFMLVLTEIIPQFCLLAEILCVDMQKIKQNR